MTIKGPEKTVRQSVLDRLINLDPRGSAGDSPQTFSESVRQLRMGLLRDVEWLLNTRRIPEPATDAYPELQRSLYHYGLPDMTSLSGDDPAVRRQLQREIEECLRLFEPRLTSITVTPVAATEEKKRELRFTIEALLRMEPNPERVVFDTVLDVSHGGFSVAGGSNA
jgi:type VI secretion system protein ImpF